MAGAQISVLCPTRGNPAFVEAQIANIAETAGDPSRVRLFYYVDNDDPELKAYHMTNQVMQARLADRLAVEMVSGDPIGTPRAINLLAELTESAAYMIVADDVVVETKGWDFAIDAVLADYPDGIFNAWFDDGVFGEKLSWCPIVGHQWMSALGYFVPVIFEHYAADQWLHTMGRFLNRNVFIGEHKLSQRRISETQPDSRYAWEVSDGAKRKMDRDNDALRRFERYLRLDTDVLRAAMKTD